jgi:hypothetical protein
MTPADITAATQQAVVESFQHLVDADVLDTLRARVGEVPYGGDWDTYLAIVTDVTRATLQPRMDALRADTAALRADTERREAALAQWQREFEEFRRMATPKTIQ